jgi:hypothetical protein
MLVFYLGSGKQNVETLRGEKMVIHRSLVSTIELVPSSNKGIFVTSTPIKLVEVSLLDDWKVEFSRYDCTYCSHDPGVVDLGTKITAVVLDYKRNGSVNTFLIDIICGLLAAPNAIAADASIWRLLRHKTAFLPRRVLGRPDQIIFDYLPLQKSMHFVCSVQ